MAVIKPVDPNEALKASKTANSNIDTSWIGNGATNTPVVPATTATTTTLQKSPTTTPSTPFGAITGAVSSGLSGLKNNVTKIATGAIK